MSFIHLDLNLLGYKGSKKMYYIISPLRIDALQKYKLPVKDKYKNKDYELFYNSKEGQEFLKIVPIRIKSERNKKELIFNLSMDISWISLCYNCDLYVYVMKDSWYYKNLDFWYQMHTNFGNLSKMQKLGLNNNEAFKYKLSNENRYYQGDIETLENNMMNNLKVINLSKNPICGFSVSLMSGIKVLSI